MFLRSCGCVHDEFSFDEWKTALNDVRAQTNALRESKLKTIQRIRKEIACSLRQGQSQEEQAVHQAGQLLKEMGSYNALQIIRPSCECILIRLIFIARQRKCPEDLKMEIQNLSFAASRCLDIPGLKALKDIFEKRFGKKFVAEATNLRTGCHVQRELITMLSTEHLLQKKLELLEEIAKDNEINWKYSKESVEDQIRKFFGDSAKRVQVNIEPNGNEFETRYFHQTTPCSDVESVYQDCDEYLYPEPSLAAPHTHPNLPDCDNVWIFLAEQKKHYQQHKPKV